MESVTQGLFKCGCCSSTYPLFHRHTHHKIPQATGGLDTPDNLIELCPGCHDALHKVAYKLLGRANIAMVKDTISFIYKENTLAQKICLELAVFVRDAMIKTREEGLNPDHLVQISTVLQKKHKDLVTYRCRDARLSQESYLRSLILSDLKRQFPHLVGNLVEEGQTVKNLKKTR